MSVCSVVNRHFVILVADCGDRRENDVLIRGLITPKFLVATGG